MANKLVLKLERLKPTINTRNTATASNIIEEISQYFDDRLSDADIDLAIEQVFIQDGGIHHFLNHTFQTNKTFTKEHEKIFELYIKVIALHGNKISSQLAVDVTNICLKYLKSTTNASAHERDKAGLVIQNLITKQLCESINHAELMEDLIRIAVSGVTLPGTVARRVYELVGCLAKEYHDCIPTEEMATNIRGMYLSRLEKVAVLQQDVTYVAIVGAFNGLCDFLVCFSPPEEQKATFTANLYKCIKNLSNPPPNIQKIKQMYRSSLNLASKHAELLSEHLYNDFYYWHKLLTGTWLQDGMQWEDKKTAIYLMHALHKEVAKQLTTAGGNELDQSDGRREILNFLFSHFKNILERPNSQPYEIRIAITGFGLMAAPYKRLMSDKLKELLDLVMHRTVSVANTVDQSKKDVVEHFPDYVEALSKIMEHVEELSGIQLTTLETIIVAVIRDFHLLSTIHHDRTVDTLMRTFHNLWQLGGTTLDDVLEKVVYKGVIWTCSHKLVFDAQFDWQSGVDWKDQVTYRTYMELWNKLLLEVDHSSYNRLLISEKIYDHLMRTLFSILNKLDLSTRKRIFVDTDGKDQHLDFCDPNENLEPNKPKDFHIFFNAVDFYCALLKEQPQTSHMNNFSKWISQFVDFVVQKSIKNPLVSGYIKLIQTALSIMTKLDYFELDYLHGANDQDEDSKAKTATIDKLYFFVKTTIPKVKQTSGELQLACLKLLFSSPSTVLQEHMVDMIPAFIIAFEIGKSSINLYIAEMALSALMRYVKISSDKTDTVNEVLTEILPSLDPYLQGFKNDSNVTTTVARKRVGIAKRTPQKLIQINENDLLKFQKRIVVFLGLLEPDQCLYLAQNDKDLQLVKWDATQKVNLTLFGPSFNPKIFLDSLMPRVCEIAVSSTDRQKKMAACELVHATILYMIGSGNHKGTLWRQLCEKMLELGCDGDFGVKQMFSPLIMQIMHYTSRTDQSRSKGVNTMLNCLFDAIAKTDNSAVRDLAARSIREFLEWAIKQSTDEQLIASPLSIEKLMDKLKAFSLDILQQKRLGAALAFNNVYSVLREENTILDKYWLELLHDFCTNFIMSEQYVEQNLSSESSLDQVSASMDHILRVLKERKNIFNTPSDQRIKPAPFAGTQLRDAVQWLFTQLSSKQHNYRRKVAEMILQLAPCVAGYNSAAKFVHDTLETDEIIELCEDGVSPEMFKQDVHGMIRSMNSFQRSLDTYIWFLENNLMADANAVFNNSSIWTVSEYYIENIMNKHVLLLFSTDAMDVDSEQDEENNEEIMAESHRIKAAQTQIMLRLFSFLSKILSTNVHWIPNALWNSKELVATIEKIVFEPNTLHCDIENPEIILQLTKSVESIIVKIDRFAPNDFKATLYKTLWDHAVDYLRVMSNSINDYFSYNSISSTNVLKLKGIELVWRLVKQNDSQLYVLFNNFMNITANSILYKLSEIIKETVDEELRARQASPDVMKFLNDLLRIGFRRPGFHSDLIGLMMHTEVLRIPNSQKTIQSGKHFFSLFKSTIFQYFMQCFDVAFDRLVSKMGAPHNLYILRILTELIIHAYKHESRNTNQMKTITNIFLGKWSEILERTLTSEVDKDGNDKRVHTTPTKLALIELMSHVAMISPYDLVEISAKAPGLREWLLKLLSDQNNDLEMKSRAFFLLPCIVGATSKEDGNEDLQSALDKFQSKNFPLRSSELRGVEQTAFENAFKVILDTLCVSKSPIILKFIIYSTASDPKHILDYKIKDTLPKFIRLLTPEQQLHCLNMTFKLFDNQQHHPSIRFSILRRFLSIMIRSASLDANENFYFQNTCQIIQLINTNYNLGMPKFVFENAFTSRIGGLELLEIMMSIIPPEQFGDPESKIYKELIARLKDKDEKGKLTVLGKLTKICLNVRKEQLQTEKIEFLEIFRKYQCAAYKLICAVVSNTKTDLRFYNELLFKENQSPIWSNLINTRDLDLYTNLSTVVDKRPKIKERLVSIRSAAKQNNDGGPQPKYIASQNIFESSLSQDVTKIDLSNSSIRTANEVAQLQSALPQDEPRCLLLEKNSVNDHEIMATLCGVIEHMIEKKFSPTSEVRTRIIIPDWVKYICNTLENTHTNKNIRLFLATVIDNCRESFRYYASYVTKSILTFLCEWETGEIDALTMFLVVDLIEWDSPDANNGYRIKENGEIEKANSLLKILMQRAWNDRKEVFKRNLELIRCLVEKWRGVIAVPRHLLSDMMAKGNDDSDSRDSVCGIHLNGIILANGLTPWDDSSKITYLDTLTKRINNTHSVVYQPAAEVLGMALNELIVKQNEDSDQFNGILRKLTNRLEGLFRVNTQKFVQVIYGIHKHYDEIVNNFLTPISGMFRTTHGTVKRMCLEMYMSRVTNYGEDIYREVDIVFNGTDLLRSPEFQLNALHIINKVLPHLTADQVKSFLPQLAEAVESKYPECRDVVYEMMKFIRKNFKEDHLHRFSSGILLNGMNDIDEKLHSNILNYWSQDEQLPAKLNERILFLFGNLYDTQSQESFLKYCAQLLLEPAINAKDSKDKILQCRYEDDSKYKEYDINVDWRTQNSVFRVPLFTESQQRLSQQNFLRATVSQLAFDPTVDPASIHQESNSFALKSQNSVLFTVDEQVLDRRSQRVHPAQATNRNQGSFEHLRQRFLRDKNEQSRKQALSAVVRRDYSKEMQSQQQKRKEGQVQLYRRYRFGDIPDFFINTLAFLLPLQALVKNDALLARQTLVTIFAAVFQELEENQQQFYTSMGDAVRKMFQSKDCACEPILFSAIIEILLMVETVSINVEPEIAETISSANNMMVNGILLLEHRLNYDLNTVNVTADRSNISALSTDEEAKHWLRLANMYYSLSEYDITTSIFANKLNSNRFLLEAIECEANAGYSDAIQKYQKLLNETNISLESDFALQSYYKCIETMGRWEILEEQMASDFTSTEDLWNVGEREKFLPYYMESGARTLIEGTSKKHQEFIRNIDCWLRNPDRAEYIKSHFAEQLMLLNIGSEEYLKAKVFSEQYFETFLADWSNTSILSDNVRIDKILSIRRVAEVHKFADLLNTPSIGNEKLLEVLTDRWNSTQMKKTDSLQMWDSLIAYRNFVSSKAKERITQTDDDMQAKLNKSLFNMNFKLIDIATQQNNIDLCKTILKRTEKLIPATTRQGTQLVLHEVTKQKCSHLKYRNRMCNQNVNETFNKITQIWRKSTELREKYQYFLQANADIEIKLLMHLGDVAEHCFEIVSKTARSQLDDSAIQTISEQILTGSAETIQSRIYKYCLNCYQETTELAEKCERSNRLPMATNFSVKESGIGESYNRLAMFCLQNIDDQSNDDRRINTEQMIVTSILRGMKHQSKSARLQFPRLLELPDMGSLTLSELFTEEMRSVPAWMFLSWIQQIVSRFDFKNKCFLDDLLLRVAKEYPTAIVYAFQLSYKQFNERKPFAAVRPVVHEILNAIRSPTIEKFIAAIGCLSLPEEVIKAYIYPLERSLNKNYSNLVYRSKLQKVYEEVFENEMRGNFGKLSPDIRTTFDKLTEMKVPDDYDEIAKSVKKVMDYIRNKSRVNVDRIKLREVSKWFNEYHWHSGDNFIEMLGQYTGDSPPNVEKHLKIIRFDPIAEGVSSLRKPIKIKVLCSDGKWYTCLVKYGEDLRLDERIQQLQRLMSDQLKADRDCSQHKLALRTYNICPMSPIFGVISWVDNTQSTEEFLHTHSKDWHTQNKDIKTAYLQFIHGNPTGGSHNNYLKTVAQKTPHEIKSNLEELSSKISDTLLRAALYKISASPECFFALRNNFAKSLAVMCISNWILGIGDRHLLNLLLDQKNGQLIGIDFNMAFGAGTRDYLIPELVPCRLTRQFVNVLRPMETSGLLKKCMAHTLRTFRNERKLLLACMEVFIKDPTIDWLETVHRSNNSSTTETIESSASSWRPKQRVNTINEKLLGTNPRKLIADDLAAGEVSKHDPYLNGYLKLLNGNATDIRNKVAEKELSVEDQVDCLIDIATDPSILGVTYIGFKPWL